MILDGKRMSIKEAKRKIKRLAKGRKIRMQSNPYRPHIVRIDFIDDNYPSFSDTIWAEDLTDNTMNELISLADEIGYDYEYHRYW